MPFQGIKTDGDTDMLSLALQIRAMRMQEEHAKEEMRLKKIKTLADIEAAKEKNRFEFLKLSREISGQEAQAGANLAPALSVAADDNAPAEDRAAAARSYLPALLQEAQFRAGPDATVTADILNQVGNEAASAGAIGRATAKPNLDWEYDSNGNKRRVLVAADGSMKPVPGAVWVPPKAGVTVNVNPDGLDTNQLMTGSRAEQAAFRESMAPFEAIDKAQATMRNVRKLADENGILPQQASQIVASDAMGALRAEALNEGDVARLTAVGLWNKALARIGLPPEMTVKQLDTLSRMIDDKAKDAAPKRRALVKDAVFRAKSFGFDPRLIIGPYADESRPKPAKEKPNTSRRKSSGRPTLTAEQAAAEGLE